MSSIDTSVIVPNLDCPLVGRTLEALAAAGAPGDGVEVLVVGRDAPGQVPRDGSVRFVETVRALNPAEARNLGVEEARGERLLFTDADCAPRPGWLEVLVSALEGSPVAGGAVVFPTDSAVWALADNIASFHDLLPDRPAEADSHGTLGSLNLAMTRAAWQRVGSFDPELTTSEDVDWVLRARAAGLATAFVPAAVVEHAAVRRDRAALVAHATWYGRHFRAFCSRHPGLFDRGPTWASRRRLALAAPAKSLVSSLQIFARHRRLWPHLRALPGVVAFKRAWYRAVLESWDEGGAEPS
ncbi:MAG: glycosyltransferase [Acidobacteria bacterium]|nr:glycosyltransferase [Acidobacteriota bacterium]